MAAYAALVSLMYIIEQLEHHPRPPVTLDKQKVQSLTEKVVFLQEFLEGYSHVAGYSKVADALESRIADAAYAAEDVIESHIVGQIVAGSMGLRETKTRKRWENNSYFNCFGCLQKATSRGKKMDQILAGSTSHGEKISSDDFYEDLQKVMEDMDLIKREVMEIKEKIGVQDQLQSSSMPAGSLRSTSTGQNTMVGYDDVCLQIMDKLTGGGDGRQIIPIVGMGGIGKTTLARHIYQNQIVVERFDILVWATISQQYQLREILLELLPEGVGNSSQTDKPELGEKLYKGLSGRRYLIIIDDIWDSKVWDQLKLFFPDNNNGSRIILTTRLLNLASDVADADDIKRMAFLDEGNSWNLFSKTVFGEKRCPLELEEIGKKIVKNCKGLPLSIVVIGGLLAKSKNTREYWEYIAENLNSVVNSEDDENYSKILRLSYNHLPVFLKPCFLYMGIFPEDNEFCVSRLIKLWVAEGFLKPMSGKPLEEIAKGYLEELIDRNLILVHKLGSIGNIRYCKIHDLLRDLCLKEAQKERFYYVTWQHSLMVPPGLNTNRRLLIDLDLRLWKVHDALQPVSLVRSLMSEIDVDLQLEKFRLLRIITGIQRASIGRECYCSYGNEFPYFPGDLFQLVNARYLEAIIRPDCPSSVYLLWNLQTLILSSSRSPSCIDAPAEIWNMPQLRHVICRAYGLSLPDPPSGNDGRRVVLENLQTLVTIINLKCGEEVIKRIPNITKLAVCYRPGKSLALYDEQKRCIGGGNTTKMDREVEGCCLTNLEQLSKLESFHCEIWEIGGADLLVNNLTFPRLLKKLTLSWGTACGHGGDVMFKKIGSLPLLQKFKLSGELSFEGGQWETIEGQFRSLKFLQIKLCENLKYWRTESSHFPCLEHLVLKGLTELEEIPSEIGEISTLKSIKLDGWCSDSAINSAKTILEEQEELHGEVGLQVLFKSVPSYYIRADRSTELAKKLACANFRVL